jgi:hypothetical protein
LQESKHEKPSLGESPTKNMEKRKNKSKKRKIKPKEKQRKQKEPKRKAPQSGG